MAVSNMPLRGSLSTAEPSAAALAKMQEFKEHKTAVIRRPIIDDAIAKTVASATGAELRPSRTLGNCQRRRNCSWKGLLQPHAQKLS